MRYHKCPGCSRVFKVEDGLCTVMCRSCDYRSTVPVDSDTPLPFSLQRVMAGEPFPEVRYATTATARMKPIAAGAGQLAKIAGMSETSIDLLSYRRFESKTLLHIEIEDVLGVSLGTFIARVVRPVRVGDEQWVITCTFCKPIDNVANREICELLLGAMVPLNPQACNVAPARD